MSHMLDGRGWLPRIGLGSCLILSLLGAPKPSGAATTIWYVSGLGDDAASCTLPASPCRTPQGAASRAAPGDEIRFTADTFVRSVGAEVLQVDTALTLSGGWNADFTAQSGFTTLSGEALYRVITITANGSADLNHFIVESGTATYVGDWGGGGIFNQGTARVSDSEIRDNRGGGIASQGPLTIVNSSLIGNQDRGAILSWVGPVTLTNSTLSNNAGYSCGGLCMQGPGPAQVSNSTIVYNSAVSSPGAGVASFYPDGLIVRNSIIALNVSSDCQELLTLAGYNLLGKSIACTDLKSTPTDQIDVAPVLGELTGMPRHRPLQPGSPGLNAGDPAGCRDAAGQPIDQDARGAARVGRCDVGALETGLSLDQNISGVTLPGGIVTVRLTVRNAEAVTLVSGVAVSETLAAELTLVPGSLSATTGSVSVVGDTIGWQGEVGPAAPTVIRYSATLDPGVALDHTFAQTAFATWHGWTTSATATVLARARLFMPLNATRFCADFFDDFSRATSGWPVRDDAIAQFAYAGGEYLVNIKQPYVELIGAPACARTNYELEVDLHRQPSLGLVTGVAFDILGNFDAAHLLVIDQDHQRFELIRFNLDGTATQLIGWTNAFAITLAGGNHIRVNRNGPAIVIAVNQTVIASLTDATIAGPTYTGVLAYPTGASGQASFDNFSVRQLPEFGPASRDPGESSQSLAIWPFSIGAGLEGLPVERSVLAP